MTNVSVFIATLLTIARTWKQPRCPLTDWMGKEDVVHIYKGILLSPKKEWIWISSSEVDEPWAGSTEWSKSEKQMSYLNTYVWNLEKWYWRTYLQGRNGDAVVEYGLVDTVGEGERGMNGEVASTYICIYSIMCKIDSWREVPV